MAKWLPHQVWQNVLNRFHIMYVQEAMESFAFPYEIDDYFLAP